MRNCCAAKYRKLSGYSLGGSKLDFQCQGEHDSPRGYLYSRDEFAILKIFEKKNFAMR